MLYFVEPTVSWARAQRERERKREREIKRDRERTCVSGAAIIHSDTLQLVFIITIFRNEFRNYTVHGHEVTGIR